MHVLAIETATAVGSVAVVGADGTVTERSAQVPAGHLEWLAGAIEAVLAEAGLAPDAIGGLAVSVGPGGFMGVRIGIATAAAWAHTAHRPVLGISTLGVIASGAAVAGAAVGGATSGGAAGEGATPLVLAALDARRGDVVGALFKCDRDVRRLTADILAPPDRLRDRLPVLSAPVLVAGDALARHAGPLVAALSPWALAAPPDLWWPRASALGRLARTRLLAGEGDDPLRLRPVYVRPPVQDHPEAVKNRSPEGRDDGRSARPRRP